MQFSVVLKAEHLHRSELNGMKNFTGVYPCGEGAGYAGGITSAAVDGIKVAEAIAVHTGPSL